MLRFLQTMPQPKPPVADPIHPGGAIATVDLAADAVVAADAAAVADADKFPFTSVNFRRMCV